MLKIEDLKEGEIYRYIYPTHFVIGLCLKSTTKKATGIWGNTKEYSHFDKYYSENDFNLSSSFEHATNEEKHWLNECIKANKFIPYEEAMKTFKQENNTIFSIFLNNQEELNACRKFYNNLGFKETLFVNEFSEKIRYFTVYSNGKLYQNVGCNNYPLKTLSELGITVSLIGRYLKYIGNSKNLPKYGDYFRITTDEKGNNLLRLSDNISNCHWRGTEELLSKLKNDYWELMPEGWTPEQQNTPQSNTIPEYVECITDKFESIHKGIIYKLIPNLNKEWYCLDGINIGSYSSNFFKPSTKEAYEAQFQQSIVSNNDIIEVGDEVEITHSAYIYKIGIKGILLQIDNSDDIPYKIKTETKYKETWCRDIKLIKKASQTTNYIHEKQVAGQPTNVPITTDIKIPKSVSVTLTNTEKEVKLNVKKPKSIKI